ncbi:MAG: YtxH domain-containing protein [bacterium]|nr:YtxH domain-containing protein [bacterium]
MTDNNYNRGGGGSTLTGFIFGVLVGVAAVILSDKKKREEVKRKLNKWAEKGEEQFERIQDKAEEVRENLKQGVKEEKEKAENDLERNRKKVQKPS